MNASITLKSKPDQGTTFFIRLPTDGVSFDLQDEASNNSPYLQLEENFSKLNILILIQDELNKQILKKFLLRLNCPLYFAQNYEDFVNKLKTCFKFNVCIVDSDQFSSGQQSKIRKLIDTKREMEHKIQRNVSMILLSTLDMDSRQRSRFLSERVILLKKPVKQAVLKNYLTHI